MQIGNNSPLNPRPGQPRGKPANEVDITRDNREGIKKVAEDAEIAKADKARKAELEATSPVSKVQQEAIDKVEISDEAKVMSSEELPGPRGAKESPEARSARVQGLKGARASGELNTSERIDKAADLLLSGE